MAVWSLAAAPVGGAALAPVDPEPPLWLAGPLLGPAPLPPGIAAAPPASWRLRLPPVLLWLELLFVGEGSGVSGFTWGLAVVGGDLDGGLAEVANWGFAIRPAIRTPPKSRMVVFTFAAV